jgi:uncharacterized protein involved in exopolysaccharide biosynthesis
MYMDGEMNVRPNDRDEDVSLAEMLDVARRHRRMMLVLPVACLVAFAGISLLQARTYSASASFLPNNLPGARTGGIAGMARSFGIQVPGGGEGQSPDFYVQLLQSRDLLARTVEDRELASAVDNRQSLADLWEIDTGTREGKQAAIRRLRRAIQVNRDRNTGLVSYSVSASTPELADRIAVRILHHVEDFNLERRQSAAAAEREFLDARLAEATAELRDAERELEEFLRQNRQFRNSPELVFTHDRLQRQVALRQDLVSGMTQSFEEARIETVRNTPLVTVIDDPEGSAVPNARRTATRGITGFGAGVFLAFLLALSIDYMRGRRRVDLPPRGEDPQHAADRDGRGEVRRPHSPDDASRPPGSAPRRPAAASSVDTSTDASD